MTDKVNLGVAPAATTSGPKDAELAAKFDKANEAPTAPAVPAAEKPTRPDGIPEKFWDDEKGEVKVDDLAKSYAELEKKSSTKKDESPEAEAAAAKAAESTDEVKDALAAAGLDFDSFDTEFATDGKLSDDSYAKLAKAGYAKEVVDVYVAGLAAQGTALIAAAHESAGGEEQFSAMQQWALANAAEGDLAAYNEMISSADPAKVRLAVQGLYAKYAEAEGEPAKRTIDGGGNGGGAGDAYESVEQMKADMRNPLYKKDPAFRAKVEQKLGRSKIM